MRGQGVGYLVHHTFTSEPRDPPPAHLSIHETRAGRGTLAYASDTLMAQLIETRDLTDPSQSGWAVDHRIRREDGEELHIEVRCWDKARGAAELAKNTEALEAIADRGLVVALEHAELVDSPAERGAVIVSIWFDPADDGNLRHRVSYERGSD
jgi:hypothetical protein